MIKCFLSHSSKDKESFVKHVADALGKDACVYDAYSFEGGLRTLDEIMAGISESQLFIVFISNAALDSKWVQTELGEAINLKSKGYISRLMPIIIDEQITHNDARIPQIFKDEYVLRPILRPSKAARMIKRQLVEQSFARHPKLKEREELFIGRNDLIEKFEERIDDFGRNKPICVLAAGLKDIGRTTYITKCFRKCGVIPLASTPSVVSLSREESIEDFIIKIHDLGFTADERPTNMMKMSPSEKINIAVRLVKDVQGVEEVVIIKDDYCIVSEDHVLAPWFEDILIKLESTGTLTFGVTSNYRIHSHQYIGKDYVFAVDVPELDPQERVRLLARCARAEELEISVEDFTAISNILSGFPGQVFFAIEMVKVHGAKQTIANSNDIVRFNKERAAYLIAAHKDNDNAMQLLALLCRFDFISFDFIFEVNRDNASTKSLLETFLYESICECVGSNKEYIRVNDVVRDFVTRSRVPLRDSYKSKLKQHLESFITTYKTEDKDAADLIHSFKSALLEGIAIDESYLVPSHFMKVIKELYDQHKKYQEVVALAYRVIRNNYTLDPKVLSQIRYYLCMSLARMRDRRCLEEAKPLPKVRHDFVLGFFYRQSRRYPDAIARFESVLQQDRRHHSAKDQLAQIYIHTDEYEKASIIAKSLYEENSFNPYCVYTYFISLICNSTSRPSPVLLESLLKQLEVANLARDTDMYLSALALFHAFSRHDREQSLVIVNQAIDNYPGVIYPIINKFKICCHFRDLGCMREVVNDLENEVATKNSIFIFQLVSAQGYCLSAEGQLDAAHRLVDEKLTAFPESSRIRLKSQLAAFCSK